MAAVRHARPTYLPRGQALVEFALVVPWFFLLLYGTIEGGRFVFYYEVLNNATREGARYAIVNGANSLTCPTGPPQLGTVSCNPDGSNVVTAVRKAAFAMAPSAILVTPNWCDSPPSLDPYNCPDANMDGLANDGHNARGSTVTVTANYTYTSLLPIPFPPITVSAESSLVINN